MILPPEANNGLKCDSCIDNYRCKVCLRNKKMKKITH